MNKLLAAGLLVSTLLAGCRGFQRQDSRDGGFAHALECVEVQGDAAERAAELCSRRGFDPSVPRFREGFMAALDCVRGKGGTAAEAAAACRTGA